MEIQTPGSKTRTQRHYSKGKGCTIGIITRFGTTKDVPSPPHPSPSFHSSRQKCRMLQPTSPYPSCGPNSEQHCRWGIFANAADTTRANSLASSFHTTPPTLKVILKGKNIFKMFRRTPINVSMTTSRWSFITIITKSNTDAKIRSSFRRSNKSRFATDNKLRAHTLTPPCGQKVSFYSSSFNLSSTTIMVEGNPSKYELSPLDNKETKVKTRKYFPCQIK